MGTGVVQEGGGQGSVDYSHYFITNEEKDGQTPCGMCASCGQKHGLGKVMAQQDRGLRRSNCAHVVTAQEASVFVRNRMEESSYLQERSTFSLPYS